MNQHDFCYQGTESKYRGHQNDRHTRGLISNSHERQTKEVKKQQQKKPSKSFNGNLWQQVRMPGHLVGWPAYGTTDQRGGWPSVARLTWDQRGGAGDWGMVSNGGSHEVSRWHQTSCQQRRRCPQLKSLRCSSTMFTRVHGLSYRGKNRRAAGIESHKLLLGNDVLPETWAKNRESTPTEPVFKNDVTEILTQEIGI